VDKAIQFRERNVVGIGIGGDERRGPAEWFKDAYARAKNNGLRLTAHAGETTGPECVAASINALGAERIGHGLSAVQSPELMKRMARERIPVEICLSSNVRTGCCAALKEHPLPRYVEAGMMVTLSSDDPAMFGTSLAKEYQIAQDVFGFTDEQLREFAKNSFRASFLTEERKREFLVRL
jgi:aminodeoxyfutalosine deaminase